VDQAGRELELRADVTGAPRVDLDPVGHTIHRLGYHQRRAIARERVKHGVAGAGYAAYLQQIEKIYADIKQLLKPDARAVLEVSNLKDEHGITTLAWDVARAVSNVLVFEGEVVIGWDSYGYGYDHSYCLVFRKP